MIKKDILPENMGELSCIWRDDLGECPNNCPFSDLCLEYLPNEVKKEAIFHIFEQSKKIFQKCKTCSFSRPSWKKKYVYYCTKNSTHHPKKGGCYVDPKTIQPKRKEETSWIDEYYGNKKSTWEKLRVLFYL